MVKSKVLFLFVLIILAGCFNKKDDSASNAFEAADISSDVSSDEFESIDDGTLISEEIMAANDASDPFLETAQPFYPTADKFESIEKEMADLRAKMLDYESRIRNQDNSLDRLNKIQFPHLTHEIELTNGTLIRGTIIQENSDQMIVKTQIGQLTLDKGKIAKIKNIAPNIPEVIFEGDAIDEKYPNSRVFAGTVINDGYRRADFVRVIFKLWSEKTELIGVDSSFVEGSKYVYNSGVISDTSIEPGYSAEYVVSVNAESSLVRYVTREIKWDVFE